jgi:PEP-CTERM motif
MIRRIFMAAVLLGGLCGVSSFANTFIVGVENNPSATDPIEGVGDFNDMIVQFGATGLTATSGGSWLAFGSGIVNNNGASTSNPFWDNNSLDNPGGSYHNDNVGFGLTGTAATYTLTSPAAVSQYLTTTGNDGLPPDFFFTFSGAITPVFLGTITPNGSGENLGIYNTANGGQFEWIILNGAVNAGSGCVGSGCVGFVTGTPGNYSFTSPYASFGLLFQQSSASDVFYSQNATVPAWVGGSPTGVADSRFALFQLPDASVPEPGTMAMFGLGALALGLIPRLRKR